MAVVVIINKDIYYFAFGIFDHALGNACNSSNDIGFCDMVDLGCENVWGLKTKLSKKLSKNVNQTKKKKQDFELRWRRQTVRQRTTIFQDVFFFSFFFSEVLKTPDRGKKTLTFLYPFLANYLITTLQHNYDLWQVCHNLLFSPSRIN